MARYLTTTLPYVNADPHMGHALEFVQADFLVRTWRAQGEEVFFSTGTDEHGQKIAEAAAKAGQEPQAYVDHFATEFQKLKELLSLSNDTFVRTTDAAHIQAAQEMWRLCSEAGDIYKKAYEGLYCVGCETFYTEKELIDGKTCPIHLTEATLLKEENYFFALSKYAEFLKEYLSREESVVPEWRRAEALAFVESGLEDVSISREAARLSWGIRVPGDDTQVMYVWFDALTNYISTLGWPKDEEGRFAKFWEGGWVQQVAGKDQIRFQSLLWQAMLKSAGIKNSDSVFYHGFITSGGQKMSKSLGNVISPRTIVDTYGSEALRYILLRHVSPSDDSDLTAESIREHYTANLTNGIGNLVARVMKLSEEHVPHSVEIEDAHRALSAEFIAHVEAFRFNEALDYVFKIIGDADAYMTEHKPFSYIKSGDAVAREKAKADIEHLVQQLSRIATHLSSAMPRTAAAIHAAVRKNEKPENLFPRL